MQFGSFPRTSREKQNNSALNTWKDESRGDRALVASAQTHREWNHTDKKAPWKPCLRGGFNLGSAPGTDHRDESDQRLLLALLFVLRKRLENRRLPIMHTRDWKTNLKGQDLFSKIITIKVIKQKN